MAKKIFSVLMALLLICSTGVFALAEGEYSEHFEISLGTVSALADDSWADNYFNKLVQEKFNVSFKPYSSSAGFDEVTNLWISTGDMPDWIVAGESLQGLMEYADQGLLAALPKGWQERYPNLAAEVNSTGVESYCQADGTWYILPRSTFGVGFDLEFADHAPGHVTRYYRTDWLEEKLPDVMTAAELKAVVEKVVAEKTAAGEKVYGISGNKAGIVRSFLYPEAGYFKSIYPQNGEYVLGAKHPGVIQGIKNMKEWYDDGLIDPDFFNRKTDDFRNMFYLGSVFMIYNDGGGGHAGVIGNGLMQNNPEMTEEPAMGMVNLVSSNGEDFYFTWANGFYRTVVFSPALEEQPEKFERILAIMDYLALPETICTMRLGERGVNWDYDENGRPYVIKEYIYNASTGADMLYSLCPSAQDAFGYGYNPSVPAWAVKMSVNQMNIKSAAMQKNEKMPTLKEITVFNRWVSDNKTLFSSIGWEDEVVRIVLAEGADVETEWNNFIEANKGLWQPLLDEMNASLK